MHIVGMQDDKLLFSLGKTRIKKEKTKNYQTNFSHQLSFRKIKLAK
jgi:hypothetical protein